MPPSRLFNFSIRDRQFRLKSGAMVRLFELCSISLLILALCGSHEVTAQDYSRVVARSRNAIALIFGESSDGKFFSGTVFAATRSGVLVTAAHVVEGAKSLAVKYPDGALHPAKPILVWREEDLALVSTSKAPTYGLPGRESPLRVGEVVIVIGYPLADKLGASQVTVTQGIVSALRRYVQLNVAVNPGNSGGPVLDASGSVIGVLSGVLSGSGLAFAIPWTSVKASLEALARSTYPVTIFRPDGQEFTTGWLEQGIVLVGARQLADLLGGAVLWDQQTRVLTLSLSGKLLKFHEGAHYMEVDGRRVVLPLPLSRDRKIPLKSVVSALGGTLDADLSSFTILIQLPQAQSGERAPSSRPATAPATQPTQAVPAPAPTSVPPPVRTPTPAPTATVIRALLPDGSQSWTVRPGIGIGPIVIGSPRAQIEALLGPADETATLERFVVGFYRQLGLAVYYSPRDSLVDSVALTAVGIAGLSAPTTPIEILRTTYVTQAGVRLGDSRTDLFAYHGVPVERATVGDAEAFGYRGILFTIRQDRVIQIIVLRAS